MALSVGQQRTHDPVHRTAARTLDQHAHVRLQRGAQGIGERGVAIEMLGAGAKGLHRRGAQWAECIQAGDAGGFRAATGFGMQRNFVIAEFAHVAEHQPALAGCV